MSWSESGGLIGRPYASMLYTEATPSLISWRTHFIVPLHQNCVGWWTHVSWTIGWQRQCDAAFEGWPPSGQRTRYRWIQAQANDNPALEWCRASTISNHCRALRSRTKMQLHSSNVGSPELSVRRSAHPRMQLYTAVRTNIEHVASRDWCIL
jgi:hypothetical protein